MSVGRFAMRGRVFQGRAFAGYTLANSGAGVVATQPIDGWTANAKQRHWTATENQRHWVAKTKQRLWTIGGGV